jgi:hypothetical protein
MKLTDQKKKRKERKKERKKKRKEAPLFPSPPTNRCRKSPGPRLQSIS